MIGNLSEEGLQCLSQKSSPNFKLSPSFTFGQRDVWALAYLPGTYSAVLSMKRSWVKHATAPSAEFAFTTSSSLTFQDVNSLHSQLMALHTPCEFVFLIRRKGPFVELGYLIQRLADISQGKENTRCCHRSYIFMGLWNTDG